MRWFPLAVVLISCTGVSPTDADSGDPVDPGGDDWQPVSYVDQGEICTSTVDTDVVVYVTAPGCLSSSCSRELAGGCSATVSGTTITLTSDIHWEQNQGEDVPCTDDCGSPTVWCTVPALADGTYTLVHGAEQTELVVPIVDTCPVY